jgi:hypothetical protein
MGPGSKPRTFSQAGFAVARPEGAARGFVCFVFGASVAYRECAICPEEAQMAGGETGLKVFDGKGH